MQHINGDALTINNIKTFIITHIIVNFTIISYQVFVLFFMLFEINQLYLYMYIILCTLNNQMIILNYTK